MKAGGDQPLTAVSPPPHHQVHANLVGSNRFLSLFFFFLPSFLVLIHFVVTMELRSTFMFLICCFCFDFRFFVLIKFVFFPVLDLLLCVDFLLCLLFDCVTV